MDTDPKDPAGGAPAEASAGKGAEPESASRDLADGLELMLRAARKAIKNVDPTRIEDLGRRAMRGLENLDRQKVSDLGRKAAPYLDPRRVEQVAEEAGKELLAVVERVAERLDNIVTGSTRPRSTPPEPDAAAAAAPEAEKPTDPATPRVRVDTKT
jgi:hypothetical protein